MKNAEVSPSNAAPPIEVADQLSERLAQLGHEHCIFSRNGELFAIPVSTAREVLFDETPAPVPLAPEIVVGVINLRGEVLPLVRFDLLLGFPARVFAPEDHVLVLAIDGIQLGLVVDRVREVRPINPLDIKAATEAEVGRPHVKGYWEGPLGVVNVLDARSLAQAAVALARDGFQQRRMQGVSTRELS
ncbi:MAG: chemotaxis protein CheW [Candidatus Binatia bacterium]|nr:chemotaxis protein CheW [Candidatus Binatia bacterium]